MSVQEIIASPFFWRALTIAMIIGFANGCLSSYVVLRKASLVVGAYTHGTLPGIAAAVLLGGVTMINVFVGAAASALFIGLGSVWLMRHSRVDHHSALALMWTTGAAIGLFIIDRTGATQELEGWLFGYILTISDQDLWASFIISSLMLMIVVVLQRPLLLMLFEPDVAASVGVPVRRLHYLLVALFVFALVSSLQAVGAVLATSTLVAPALIMIQLADSPRKVFWGGGLIGSGVSALAIVLSHVISVRPGALIVVLLAVAFGLAVIFGSKYGVLHRLRHGAHRHQ